MAHDKDHLQQFTPVRSFALAFSNLFYVDLEFSSKYFTSGLMTVRKRKTR